MTKGELRKARKEAARNGKPLSGELSLSRIQETDRHSPATEFTESHKGYEARWRWAVRYDRLNGAPEGDWDR